MNFEITSLTSFTICSRKPRKLCYKRLTESNNAKVVWSVWLKKLRKYTFKTLTYQILLTTMKFWTTATPLFNHKVKTNHKINLIKKKF